MAEARGARWESAAAEYLAAHGLDVVARGYRCRLGELDLVCRDAENLVVVEVRARRTTRFGSAAETVGHAKRARIVLATRHFLMRHPEWRHARIRFDVVTFDAIESAEPRVGWIRNAFEC